jgi:polysaccharide biosynthesis/export protein
MLLGRVVRLTIVCAAGATWGVAFCAQLAYAQTVAETPQQANARIKELSEVAAKAAPHDYIIGNGDLIDVEVFDVKELSREARVSQTGTISMPLVPVRLHVAGLTEAQAEQKIAEVLEANGLVTSPAVSVTVKEHKSKPITIVGAVNHPQVYQSDHQVTLLEVLAEAGGIANDAGDSVIITRQANAQFADVSEPPAIGPEVAISSAPPAIPGSEPSGSEPPSIDGQKSPAAGSIAASAATAAPSASPAPVHANNTITVNLNDLVETGDATNNIQLQAGDIITVPHAGIVYVLGAVGKPGGYILSNDRTEVSTLKILALAGGLTPTAKSDHALIVRKNAQGQQHDVEVDLKLVLKRQTEDVQLLPSDILYVPDSRGKAALLKAAELGIALGSGVALYRIAYH